MSSTHPTQQAWPVARQGAAQAINHPAWEHARNAVLDLAAEGPVTIVLVGEAGTGKTWLLRELAGSFGDHGFPSTLLLQGDLPAAVSDGAALLVDEALRMPDAALDDLLRQRRGVVVLADMERLHDRVAGRVADPVVVRLRPIESNEVADFIAEWLHRAGLPPSILEGGALTRLALHGRGSVRLLAKLLGAAVAMRKVSGKGTISAGDFDLMVEFRLRGLELPPDPAPAPPAAPDEPQEPQESVAQPLEPEPVAAAPLPPVARARRRRPRGALTALAVAACAALVWGLRHASSDSPGTQPAPEPAAQTAALPPLRPAEIAGPSLAASSEPLPAMAASPALVPTTPPLVTATLDPPSPAVAPEPAVPATPLPQIAGAGDAPNVVPSPPAAPAPILTPVVVASGPALATPPASFPRSTGAPGMVLIAQRGETLQSMYNDIYRDRAAPPFAEILAVNPRPFRPGAIVVFPAPPGGWTATQ